MPRDGVTVDPYLLAMAEGAGLRAAHYRHEAEKFRRMAETETDEDLRRNLLALAKQYDDLANNLIPPEGGDGHAP